MANVTYNDESTLKEKISDLIVHCLNTEEKLPTEREMMEQFHVTRAQLREQLSVYEASGILVSQQGSGRYVKQPDLGAQICDTWSLYIQAKPALLLELLDIRAMLDIASIPMVLEKITPVQLHEMGTEVAAMKHKAREKRTFASNDRQFHQIMITGTGNQLLSQLHGGFWDLYEQFSIETYHEGLEAVAEQHEKMLDAIVKKDAALLEGLMKDQYDDAKHQILMYLVKGPKPGMGLRRAAE